MRPSLLSFNVADFVYFGFAPCFMWSPLVKIVLLLLSCIAGLIYEVRFALLQF